jgi:tetratricopeptide (TPR) repeat protein
VDTEFFLCALYRRESQTLKAVPLVEDLIRRFPRNYLLRLELSQMYSMAGDKQHALEAVSELERLKRANAPGAARVPWEKIYFQRGTIEFWYRDFERALEDLKLVSGRANEIDLNSGSYAFLRIGQIYDLTGRRTDAVIAYRSVIQYAPQSEAAGEAKRYLSTPYRRA